MDAEEVARLQTVISDEGKAIGPTVKDLFGDPHVAVCVKHKATRLQSPGLFSAMIKSTTPGEYAQRKHRYILEDPAEFEKMEHLLPYLAKWERDLPRDLLLTNGIAESFNAMCVKFRGMERFALFKNIYSVARSQIIELRRREPREETVSESQNEVE